MVRFGRIAPLTYVIETGFSGNLKPATIGALTAQGVFDQQAEGQKKIEQ